MKIKITAIAVIFCPKEGIENSLKELNQNFGEEAFNILVKDLSSRQPGGINQNSCVAEILPD